MEAIRENPISCSSAQSISVVATAADCDRSASLPGRGILCATPALSFAFGAMIPTVSGPTMRRVKGRAASSIRWVSPSTSFTPGVSTTARRQPFSPSSVIRSGRVSRGTASTAMPGAVGRS